MAFARRDVISQTIAPLVEMRDSMLIGVSTPAGEENAFTKLMQHKEFDAHMYQRACADCIAAKRATLCPHMDHLAPAWKDIGRESIAAALMGSDEKLQAQESRGVITTDDSRVFEASHIAAFFDAPGVSIENGKVRVLWVFADPNGGGQSKLALLACTYITGKVVLLAGELEAPSSRQQVRDALRRFIRGLRAPAAFPEAAIIFVPENNLGFESSAMAYDDLRSFSCISVAMQVREGASTAGIRITERLKDRYVSDTSGFMLQRRIARWGHFQTRCPGGASKYWAQARTELERFRSVTTLTSYGGLSHTRYTGKVNGGTDDFVIVLLMACYWVPRALIGRGIAARAPELQLNTGYTPVKKGLRQLLDLSLK